MIWWQSVPFILALVTLCLSISAAVYVARQNAAESRLRFRDRVSRTEYTLRQHLENYIATLRATAGFLSTHRPLSARDFHRFVARLELGVHYPGFQGIGFARQVPTEEIPSLVDEIRLQKPDFRAWGIGPQHEHAIVVYMEPLDERNARVFGFDTASESVRWSAMQRAAQSGLPTASGKLRLVQDPGPNSQAGLVIYVPVYDVDAQKMPTAQRSVHVVGYVFSAFRMDDLLDAVFPQNEPRLVDFEIYDSAFPRPDSLMNQGPRFRPATKEPARLSVVHVIHVADRPWTIRYTAHPGTVRNPYWGLPLTLGGLGLLVSYLLYRIARGEVQRRMVVEQYRLLVEQSILPIQILNAKGEIAWANRAWEDLWGLTLAEAAGYRILDDMQLKDKGVMPFIEMAFAGHAAQLPAVPYRPPIGRRTHEDVWVRGLIYPLRGPRGEVREVVLVQEDITELKRTEEELRRSRDDLEQRVADRTRELQSANQALVQEMEERSRAEAELQQSRRIEAVGRLAGGVAHDFNNLITGVVGIAQDLLSTFQPQDPRVGEIQEILKASQKAATLTHQLLAFGRRQVMAPEVLQLNSIVTEMEKMFRRLIGEDVRLETALDPSLGYVRADRTQIEQVILNLVLNARDAMPHGGQLRLETHNRELDGARLRQNFAVAPGSYVELSVSDSGIGMTPETQSHIFEPYFTTKPGGTGLGLATVYGIVKQNEGDVVVKTAPGQGTSFSIYLPRTAAPKAATGEEKAPAAVREGTETILVVEDEPIVQRVVTKALSRQGYRVLEAPNGQAALDLAEGFEGHIDLVLTDVIMPGMNGRELVHRLAEKRRDVKVLYMSGYAEDVILKRGILEPGIAFIEKSFTSEGLNRKVRQVLDRPAPAQAQA